jgi:hypothetical protein
MMRLRKLVTALMVLGALAGAAASSAAAEELPLKLSHGGTPAVAHERSATYIELSSENSNATCVISEYDGRLRVAEQPTDLLAFNPALNSEFPNSVTCYNGASFSGFVRRVEVASSGTVTLTAEPAIKLDTGQCTYTARQFTGTVELPAYLDSVRVTATGHRTFTSSHTCAATEAINASVYLYNGEFSSYYAEN